MCSLGGSRLHRPRRAGQRASPERVGALPWYLAGFLVVLAAAGLSHELFFTSRRRSYDLAVVRALGLPARPPRPRSAGRPS